MIFSYILFDFLSFFYIYSFIQVKSCQEVVKKLSRFCQNDIHTNQKRPTLANFIELELAQKWERGLFNAFFGIYTQTMGL